MTRLTEVARHMQLGRLGFAGFVNFYFCVVI